MRRLSFYIVQKILNRVKTQRKNRTSFNKKLMEKKIVIFKLGTPVFHKTDFDNYLIH